ncbi:hypothetical protein EJ08DRAFT_601037 [Tothia fuscella]|uniref:Rhodopsin domain-containing protein n=1 Tax=Tothia fuscella TaxID=1048955 RepID=A0A9P4TR87_9PEZI|nr:hypothetical protein EJ08DRAFT_601037 [Tothia fuscella]
MVRVITSTFVISLLLFIARMVTRIQLLRLWWDDYALCCAVAFATTGYGVLMASVSRGNGRHIFYVKPEDAVFIGKIVFAEGFLWVWTTALVRVAMALMLFRLKLNRIWRWGLRAMGGLQVIWAIISSILGLVQCTPIQANWNPSLSLEKCWKPTRFQPLLYTISGVNIASDIIFSLLPLTFIRSIRRPLIEKSILAFLMSLGLFASAAALVKITKFKDFSVRTDPTYNRTGVAIFGWLEAHIGILAVCVPSLSGPFQRGLRRLGLTDMTTNTPSGPENKGKRDPNMNSLTATTAHGGERTDVTDEETSLCEDGYRKMELRVLQTYSEGQATKLSCED